MKYSFWCFLIASWLSWCPSKHLVQSRTVTGAAVGFTVISGLCLEPTVGVPILRIYSSWLQFPSKLPECFLGLEWHQVGDSWVLGHRLALSYSQQAFQFKFLPLLCLSTTAHPSQWRSCWSSPWLQAAVSACSPHPHHPFLPGWLRSAGFSIPFLIWPSSCQDRSYPYTLCASQWACPELDTQPMSVIQCAVSSELYNHMWVTFFAISVLQGSQGNGSLKQKRARKINCISQL